MNKEQSNFLFRTISTYIWWKTPNEALEEPQDAIARIMDLGTLEDVRELLDLFSKQELIGILQGAVFGQFRPQSWHFWHYYLLDCQLGEVPPLPVDRRRYA
jgi:hypothetical protein